MEKLSEEVLAKNIKEIAEYDLVNKKVFGSCYAVYQNGEKLFEDYFGHCSVDKSVVVDGKTIFRLASMTKPITTIATLMLVERGLLNLEDEVSKYIPSFKQVHITQINDGNLVDLGETKTPPTIFNLLTHTSGIGTDAQKDKLLTLNDKATAKNLIEFYAKIGLDFEPGTEQRYSGVAAFAVLGCIIEKLVGKTLQEFYTEEIFKPLGMVDTTFVPTKEQWKRVIDMHGRTDGENCVIEMKENCGFADYPCDHYVAGAGLFSTLDDYVKFANMLLNKGKAGVKRIISENLVEKMSSPYIKIDYKTYWGFGVRVIGDNHPNLKKGAFGWSGAYGSHFWVSPADNAIAILMKNSTVDGGSGNQSALAFENAFKNSFEVE